MQSIHSLQVIMVLVGFFLPLLAGIIIKQRIRRRQEPYWTFYVNHPRIAAISIAVIESMSLVIGASYIIFLSPILVVEAIGFALAAFICHFVDAIMDADTLGLQQHTDSLEDEANTSSE
ncbi:MAG: hypothetical protein ACFFED_01590 [Candidatus Thorarchaeota archaeon]